MNENINIELIPMESLISSCNIDVKSIIKVIEDALVDYKNGKILMPDKISQVFDVNTQDRINCMPATLIDEGVCGVKWVSVFPNNPIKNGIPNVSGIIVLSSLKNGLPIAIMDGTFITAFRTACIGALASKYLAKWDSTVIGIIGSGEQARMHLLTMKAIHPEISVCKIASRNPNNEKDFINQMKQILPDITYVQCNSDYEKASENSDIIITAVSCQMPLLKAHTIKKGAFYCHVAGIEDEDDVALKADKIICDNWEAVKHRTQTISMLYRKGLLKDSQIYADLADIIDGTKQGRTSDDEFIYFNSVGLAFIDVAVANYYYKNASNTKQWQLKSHNIFDYLYPSIKKVR